MQHQKIAHALGRCAQEIANERDAVAVAACRLKHWFEAVAHQVGTARFGSDPATSVLDPYCRAHQLDNLYVVDASFFPSSGGVNPSLTIAANALRVADLLSARL